MMGDANHFGTSADLLSTVLQQPQHQQPLFTHFRSSSVIVQAGGGENAIAGGHGQCEPPPPLPPPTASGRSRKKRGPSGDGGDAHQSPASGNKQPKFDDGGGTLALGIKRSMTPAEVLGVNRFISPFSAEAKIPLPHELNELSAHGTTVWKRNERERQRVRCVNKGYEDLRKQLPLTEEDRRPSKVDTLRLAIAYIRHLELLLDLGHAHQHNCQCFININSEESGSSAENTPPPPN